MLVFGGGRSSYGKGMGRERGLEGRYFLGVLVFIYEFYICFLEVGRVIFIL